MPIISDTSKSIQSCVFIFVEKVSFFVETKFIIFYKFLRFNVQRLYFTTGYNGQSSINILIIN